MRAAVLEAALDLVSRRGLTALTVAEIAKASGVHETTIYRRWGSVEKLVLETILERTELEIPHPDTGSFRTDMVASMRGAIEFFGTPLGKLLVRALGSAGEEAAGLRRAYWEKRMLSVEQILERARSRGEVEEGPKGMLVFQAIIGVVYLRLFVTGESIEPELAERIVEAVLGASVGTR